MVHFRAFAACEPLDAGWVEYREAIDRSSEKDRIYSPYSPLLFSANGSGGHFRLFSCSDGTLFVLRTACELTNLAQELAFLLESAADHALTLNESLIRATRIRTLADAIDRLNFTIDGVYRAPDHDDHVHLACQAALQIYAMAIHKRVVLSQAFAATTLTPPESSPVHSLFFALRQTDTSNCWGDLCGVLLWVSLIGGGASEDASAKSWAFGIASTCCSVLLVDNGDALVESFKMLLQVATLWSGDEIRSLA